MCSVLCVYEHVKEHDSFGMYIATNCRTDPFNFGERKIYRYFTGIQKRIHKHYNLRSEIIKRILVSK